MQKSSVEASIARTFQRSSADYLPMGLFAETIDIISQFHCLSKPRFQEIRIAQRPRRLVWNRACRKPGSPFGASSGASEREHNGSGKGVGKRSVERSVGHQGSSGRWPVPSPIRLAAPTHSSAIPPRRQNSPGHRPGGRGRGPRHRCSGRVPPAALPAGGRRR
jgi:hypothetical protein